MIFQFFAILWGYFIDVLPYLVIGFLLSGLINEFVPGGWVERHLGGKGIKPLLYATILGTLLPICCLGSLPVAVSFHQKGARLGPVLAFLVATPATSLPALLVSYALLGLGFTAYIFVAVIVMGLIIGVIGNLFRAGPIGATAEAATAVCPGCGCSVEVEHAVKTESGGETHYFCCAHCRETFEGGRGEAAGRAARFKHRLKHVLEYSFVEMPREIGLEMALGLVLAALVAAITPVGDFVGEYLAGGLGYPFSLVFGMLMYICSTASVPLVHAFITQGMNIGAGMVLLMVGPVTSWGTILVLRKEFGGRILLVYLAVISAVSLTLGLLYYIISV